MYEIKRREKIRRKGTGTRGNRVPWSKSLGDLHYLNYWSYETDISQSCSSLSNYVCHILLLHSNLILGQLVEKQNKYLTLIVTLFHSSYLLSFFSCFPFLSRMWNRRQLLHVGLCFPGEPSSWNWRNSYSALRHHLPWRFCQWRQCGFLYW